MSIIDIAQQIKDSPKNIILIYAFNGVGKTRLSVEYKNITKIDDPYGYGDKVHTGVYYNAYSEDLFHWDNDEQHDNADIHLNIIPSSLNEYHSHIIDNEKKLQQNLDEYFMKFKYKLHYDETDLEKGIQAISFYYDDQPGKAVKISRGEERIFIWCFFLTLFQVSTWSQKQDAHFFIDDPVSSLDEQNIQITASTIMDVIKDNYKNKKLIITTHHVGLFSILIDRLSKSSESALYKNLVTTYILGKNRDGETILSPYGHDVFLYHLHINKVLWDSIDKYQTENKPLESYNFVLLRQLLENISSFLGKSGVFSYALSKLDLKEDANQIAQIINEQSHKDVYYYQTSVMSPSETQIFLEVYEAINNAYPFHIS